MTIGGRNNSLRLELTAVPCRCATTRSNGLPPIHLLRTPIGPFVLHPNIRRKVFLWMLRARTVRSLSEHWAKGFSLDAEGANPFATRWTVHSSTELWSEGSSADAEGANHFATRLPFVLHPNIGPKALESVLRAWTACSSSDYWSKGS